MIRRVLARPSGDDHGHTGLPIKGRSVFDLAIFSPGVKANPLALGAVANFGVISSSTGERKVQLAVKILF